MDRGRLRPSPFPFSMSQFFQDDGPKATGQKACLATTAYDSPDASYAFSIQRSRAALTAAGIQSAYFLLSGNCHVDDARNCIIQEFLLSDCTDLVFLDADVSWTPDQVVRLLRHDQDIVGGVYPFRRQDAQKAGDMPVRLLMGAEIRDGLLEVEGLPTGFMRIRRQVIETLVADAPHFKKKDAPTEVPLIFERTLENGTRWGGDLNFCNKWRRTGGKIYADYEMRLGHAAKVVLMDSLASATRRREGTTLHHIAEKVRSGTETLADLTEAANYIANHWGANEEVLALCVKLARNATGPIIESGSGLTTVLMAAATDQQVYCLEHHGLYAALLRQFAAEAGVTNISLCIQPIKDGWYDLSDILDELPDHFALGLNDGPPRQIGLRMKFFDHFNPDITICDDADDTGYAEAIIAWAGQNGRRVDFVGLRAALIRKLETKEKAA